MKNFIKNAQKRTEKYSVLSLQKVESLAQMVIFLASMHIEIYWLIVGFSIDWLIDWLLSTFSTKNVVKNYVCRKK